MRKKYTLPGLLLMLAVLLAVSACGGSSVTAGQLITNSANAMKQIKSLHMDMSVTANYSISGLPASSTSSVPGNGNITLKLSGDEVLPDQTSLQLSTSGIGNFAFAEIVKGNKLYLQSGHGQWYVMDKPNTSDSSSSISNVLTSANITQFNKLLDQLSKNVQITDHGDESLNGTSLRHITIALDKNGLMQLIKNTDAFKKLPAASQQSANDALNSVGTFNASLDFWFDEATSYLHRFELKLNVAADLS